MRKTILAAAIAMAASSALAADLPVKSAPMRVAEPLPTWTGFYIGLNGGLGYQQDQLNLTGLDDAGAFAIATGLVPGQINTRGGGGLFGGTVGYNWQVMPQWVLGIEGDIDWTGIKGNGQQALAFGPLALTTTGESKLNWLGTVRGRVGYLLAPATMIFATGGIAFGEVETNVLTTLTAGPFSAQAALNQSSTKTGWTVGGGFEHQFWGHWSLKAEYRYVDLDGTNGPFGTSLGGGGLSLAKYYNHDPIPVTFNADQGTRYQIGLIGLNYRI